MLSHEFKRFLLEKKGLTSVEYAVAGALITISLVAVFTLLGGSVAGTLINMDSALPG